MSLSIGIIGLPNVGKSTLFNALTKNKAEASNYPFCTIDPNVGIVPVFDERLGMLAKAVETEKIIPAVVEFVDIAGIVAGASKGEGLGNKFLSNIRECDAICEVVRCFEDENIIHVAGSSNPESDKETIKIELILADIETIKKRVFGLEKEARGNPKANTELSFAKKIQAVLESGEPARSIEVAADEERFWLRSLNLLSAKPHILIYNVDEKITNNKHQASNKSEASLGPMIDSQLFVFNNDEQTTNNKQQSSDDNELYINAKTESLLADLSDAERDEYLHELGMDEPGLNRLIKKAYKLLGLQSFFTAGEKEVRAWTIKSGAYAPQAAGVIHTDFEKGFIKADIVNWKDLVEAGGWQGAREKGKVRLEGRDYIMQEGDVALFKFNK